MQLTRTDTGQAIAGAAISLKVQPERGPLTTNTTLTTSADGSATTSIRPPVDAKVSAVYAGTAFYVRKVTEPLVRVKPLLSAAISSSTAKPGQAVTFAGGTTALLAAEKVSRQLYTGGKWVTKATTTVSSTGRYSFSVKSSSKGTYQMRFDIPANGLHLAATSRTVVFTVR